MIPGASAGLNLCHENAVELYEQRPALDFIQVHPEHLIQEKGGIYHSQLNELRHHYPVLLHGFGLSIGSTAPLDKDYLLVVKQLLKEHPEAVFSDHVSWSSVSHHHFHDLIPLIQTEETLEYMVERVSQAQDIIGAQILLENISSYMRFKQSDLTEIEFINELTRRSGCFVLLDVNNIWANAMNFEEDPLHVISQLDPTSVRGYHLAGCTLESQGERDVYIDHHGEAVHESVWELYRQCLKIFGAWPTLMEWENNVPPLSRHLEEVATISECLRPYAQGEVK